MTEYKRYNNYIYHIVENHNKRKGLNPEQAKDPAEMYKTMQEMRKLLKGIQENGTKEILD